MRARQEESSGKEEQALEQVVGLLEKKAAALQRLRGYIRGGPCSKSGCSSTFRSTFVLLAALTAHIVSVFFYWARGK